MINKIRSCFLKTAKFLKIRIERGDITPNITKV